ncbi:hypothetical protein KY333_02925 [Candidatus Woesearchaeota archaeon]|nr:hypothetical protein [Candidatus Woesearchaeota archaeon]MBW2993871.1 hypothetical protein [Candidatus Woesearchaeota archaeon]
MAIYVIKDSPKQSVDDVVLWSPEELKIAEAVLEKEGFEHEHSNIYSKNQATIGLQAERITIDQALVKDDIVLQLVAKLNPYYFIDDNSGLHFMSDVNKINE